MRTMYRDDGESEKEILDNEHDKPSGITIQSVQMLRDKSEGLTKEREAMIGVHSHARKEFFTSLANLGLTSITTD